jgi:hypothetical protein
MGFSPSRADRVTAMTFLALAHASPDKLIAKLAHSFHDDPVYQALLVEAKKLDFGGRP